MDQSEFTAIAVKIFHSLYEVGVQVDGVILFGSRARGDSTPGSDIDLAVLSRQFGKDEISEGALVNIHAHRAHPNAEAIPVSLAQWFDQDFVSPILNEIKKDGIALI
jgi:predicted nucleotidyltransferase